MPRKDMGAFEIFGDIAVIDDKYSSSSDEKKMIATIRKIYGKRISSIAIKSGKTFGKFRIKPIKTIWGEKKTSAICKENGCSFFIDLKKVFFSTRLIFERMRIAKQIKNNENIIVCFAGVGPFAIIASKHSDAGKIVAIEINPDAFDFMEKNILKNKCKNIEPILGDVKNVLAEEKWKGWADRIVMPHPYGDANFLPIILPCLKKGGMVHYYDFEKEKEVERLSNKICAQAKECGYEIKIISKRVVRHIAKGIVHVVIDFEKL